MSVELLISIAGSALLIAIGVIGFLLVRAINAVDTSVATLNAKVDSLTAKDTQVEVRLAELGVRLAHVEAELLSLKREAA